MTRSHSPEGSEDDYNPQEHQTCYIFTPAGDDREAAARPAKRRRTAKPKGKAAEQPATEEPEICLFPTLLNGKETETAARERWDTYNRLWADQELRTRAILDSFNQKTLDDVSAFVLSASHENYDEKIPTALVLTGPNIAAHGPLFAQFATRMRDVDRTGPVVLLTSKDAANIKGALKKLIRDATQQDEGMDDEDEEAVVGRKGAKLLNYDLQILQNWCALHTGQKVVVAIQDTEAFDSGILADLVELFSSYLDRIPFVLLLGIATSLDIFHDKLPKATIRKMQGKKFDVDRAEECLAQVFNDAVLGNKSVLRLGDSMCDLLIDRQKNHTQSIQTFIAALKYAYMSHFYANPLSIILGFVNEPEKLVQLLSVEHVQAIRNLTSFKKFIENKLEAQETEEVRKLLQDDSYLRTVVATSAVECHSSAVGLAGALEVLEIARGCISSSSAPRAPRYELLPRVLVGDLHVESPLIRELLLSVKKMNSTSLLAMLSSISHSALDPQLSQLKEDISALVSSSSSGSALTSEFDVATNSLRSTAVSKKIQLNAHKSGLTKLDSEYSGLVQKVHDELLQFFTDTLHSPKGSFLYEVFYYDLQFPHKDVFAPNARARVERALSNPFDYLNCKCCQMTREEEETRESTVKATHPPTCVVYKLYLEGGALINSFDLWSAFKSVVTGEDAEDGDEQVDVDTAQALFYRSVAEMKFLGFVKQTRKRVDHLQKFAWKGL
ncbi:origin recognition complex subunit 3 N-terminus-domain-containing protein [Sphaerosporella brunnea]|uniref:Origin recognition complex subunit 3 N-terminus-domain-containing protein n=1 Tax=Sphaerosporella brunnea TaxID=1250544 RepID=A0A5J5ESV0_9PEZI|nr:origin recognition complex subunit 3 N-terminus-domain-containing protein [Sphaerosporella brunnea]